MSDERQNRKRAFRPRSWMPAELSLVERLYPATPARDIAATLGRPVGQVRSAAKRLGVCKRRIIGRRIWKQEDVAAIRKLYPVTPTAELARKFGTSASRIYRLAGRLRIRKTAEFLAEYGGRLKRGKHASIATEFKKGHAPRNKGLRRPGWSAGRMRETQFKKGERRGAANHNWMPVGTIEFNRDGYLRMKVKDEPREIAGKGALDTNWMFVHRMVWEIAHGPIPKGHRIWWKDGNHSNCALENLEMLTDQEHMARTTIHNYPPALKQVIQLNGALKRKIRRQQGNGEKQDLRPARSSVRNVGSAQGQGAAHGH